MVDLGLLGHFTGSVGVSHDFVAGAILEDIIQFKIHGHKQKKEKAVCLELYIGRCTNTGHSQAAEIIVCLIITQHFKLT